MTEPTSAQDLFKGRHFDQEIIILCVRWYITLKLSFRDLVQMMAERGITLCHTTIRRWVQQYVPEFEKRWNHYARPVGDSWRVDETYVKFNEISGSPQIHRNQGTSENILMLRLELTHHFAKYHSLTRHGEWSPQDPGLIRILRLAYNSWHNVSYIKYNNTKRVLLS